MAESRSPSPCPDSQYQLGGPRSFGDLSQASAETNVPRDCTDDANTVSETSKIGNKKENVDNGANKEEEEELESDNSEGSPLRYSATPTETKIRVDEA